MIYEPATSRRYGKVPVSKRANDVSFPFFFYFCNMPLRGCFYTFTLYATSTVSVYFGEMNTFEIIDTYVHEIQWKPRRDVEKRVYATK